MGKHVQSVSASVNGLDAGHPLPLPGRRRPTRPAPACRAPTAPSRPSPSRSINDTCPNAHVRQQTGAALLLDCRAYELVSAANAGGYDVESDLVAGQTPFGGYPEAQRAAAGPLRRPRRRHPRHRQPDQPRRRPLRRDPRPQTAGRTEYVGIPANDPFADRALRLDRSAKPTPASTPSPSAGPTSARPASPTASTGDPGPPARRRARPGHGRLR